MALSEVGCTAGGPGGGLAEATDDDGRLILRRDDGSTVVLAVGEVSLRRAT
ncbi:MAG: hypothetical protein HY330_05255 [Chloroflexi bacterium]|nr:hypothetical protein [Chloroflexota bacterium]